MSGPVKVDANSEAGRRIAILLPVILFSMSAIFLFVAVVVFLFGQSAAADARLLAAEGVPAEATVTNRTITETRSKGVDDRWKTSTSYRVTLAFVTAREEDVSVEQAVDRARYDSLSEGQVVQVFYVPSRPTLVGFEKGDGNAGLGILWVFVAIFGLVGLGIGWLGVALRRRMVAAV